MRLTVVGGGSTYTPELVDGVARLAGAAPFTELVLVDPDADRLAVVAGFARRMLAARGSPLQVTSTSDLAAGVAGAAAVLLQLRVGGQLARAGDETFPLACGCVGQETTGAGGLAKALRTVPVVLDVAETVRAHAPDAWIVDFTNPVGIVTRALLDEGHRAVGLCNVAIGFQRLFAEWLGVAPEAVALDHVGLNHLTWIRAAHVDAVDRLPELLASHGEDLAERLELPRRVLDLLGTVPSYYLRYFYAHDEVVAQLRHGGTRAAEVLAIERALLAQYADPGLAAKPALLEQRGGAFYSEAAIGLLASLLGPPAQAATHVVDVRNDGLLPFLPDGAVVEVPARVDRTGIHPLPVAPLEPQLAGLVAHVAAYEELAVAAARQGGRDRVVAALLAHPLVGQLARAEQLADLLIAGNRAHLAWAR
jgi:6-phospho-beta-glucosidase